LDSSYSESENRQLENNENVPLKENVALKVTDGHEKSNGAFFLQLGCDEPDMLLWIKCR
jgi:hypothetical protein